MTRTRWLSLDLMKRCALLVVVLVCATYGSTAARILGDFSNEESWITPTLFVSFSYWRTRVWILISDRNMYWQAGLKDGPQGMRRSFRESRW